MDMAGSWGWKSWWGRRVLHVRQLVLQQRLRSDYLRIAGLPSGAAGSWMDAEARLLILIQKEVETVGGEPCQRKFSY